MKNKINIHNFWRSDAFIILMFAVMSVMSAAIMWHSHYVSSGFDLSFHWQRIYEIRNEILHGIIFPSVSLSTFNQTGSAVISLYPNLNTYTMAILSLFIKSFVDLYYIIWILRNFCALLISYYACKSYEKNKTVSFIFSVVYILSVVTLYFQSYNMLGTSSAIMFMPLILFGFFNLLDKNSWIELSLGMSAIILCHVLDTIFVSLLLLFLILINIRNFVEKDKIKSFFKSVILTFLIVSMFLLSFFVLMINNQISTPYYSGLISGEPLKSLGSAVLNHLRPFISIFSLLGLILGFLRYKKISFYKKQLLWLSIVFIFMTSNLFPWYLLHHTFVETIIQFPWRLFVIPELLLSYLFAILINDIFSNDKRKRLVVLITVCVLDLCVQLIGQIKTVHSTQNYAEIKTNYSGITYNGNSRYIIKDNNELKNSLSIYGKYQYDYYPKSSIKLYDAINHHLAIYDGNKHIKMKLLGNGGYEFSNKAYIKDLSLPFLYYNGINYQVNLDGKTVDGSANKNSLMTIKNVNKGHHHVRIIVHNTKMQIISYITSLIGLIILLSVIIKKYILRK